MAKLQDEPGKSLKARGIFPREKVVRSIASNPQEAGDRRAFGGEMIDPFFSTISKFNVLKT